MEWYLKVVRDNYVNFSGRAQRKEYWMFVLFNVLIIIALQIIETMVGLNVGDTGIISTLYALAVVLPSLAVGVRRLHDTGKSGWWILLSLIPILGAIVLIIFLVIDSQPGDNKYGPNPKGVSAEGQTTPATASTEPKEDVASSDTPTADVTSQSVGESGEGEAK